MVAILFTMFFIAALETTAHGNDDTTPQTEVPLAPEEPDVCVGCDDKEEPQEEVEQPQLTIEIVIDPLTGNVQYVIKGLEIE